MSFFYFSIMNLNSPHLDYGVNRNPFINTINTESES